MRARAVAVAVLLGLAAPAAAAAAPQIDLTVDGRVGANDWYTSEVRLLWTVTGADTSAGDCTLGQSETLITAETSGAIYDCDAWDGSIHASLEVPIKLDKTAPAVTALPERRADHAGWYTSPLLVRFAGTDATSGIESCSTGAYQGPDSASAAVTGSCRDRAGLVGRATFKLAYDVTPPTIDAVLASARDSAATVRWEASPDVTEFAVTRTPGSRGEPASVVYRGTGTRVEDKRLRNGITYAYTVSAVDAAGNLATRSANVRPTSPLLAPALGATLRRPPVLRWKRTEDARYYNVQLFRGKRKVLSAWPARPRYALKRRWTYAGRTRRLRDGKYRWYVFPGFGDRSERRYGEALGVRTFRIA